MAHAREEDGIISSSFFNHIREGLVLSLNQSLPRIQDWVTKSNCLFISGTGGGFDNIIKII